MMIQYPSAAMQSRMVRMIRVLTTAEDLFYTLRIQRPSSLNLTSARSSNRARGRNSPASIPIPMTMMM